MWSHTIKSSAPKSKDPPAERPARAGNNLKKKDDIVTPLEEDRMTGFDADGFSKTSKVHPYKKPLTVAKAPSFSRTTSRAGQTAASASDNLLKDSPSKSTRPVKPGQTPRSGTPARVPRTATPTQSSSRALKVGTPLKKKPPITSPNYTGPARSRTSSSTTNGVRSPRSEIAPPDSDAPKADEPEAFTADDAHIKDETNVDDTSAAKGLQDREETEDLKHKTAAKDEMIQDLQTEIQGLQGASDAETLKLKVQYNDKQTSHEHRDEETKAAFLAQIASLEAEIDDVRKKNSDLEMSQRKINDEHQKALSLKDEEIQKLSQTADGRRREQEAKEPALSLQGEFQRLHTQHKRELDEAVAAALADVEAIQVERDELIQSRDKEVKEMSDLVQELQEKVEKAHQADKDELKEAKRKHEQQLHDRAAGHEQEVRDVTRRFEDLQERVSQLEQELRDVVTERTQERNDAKIERQTILRDATEKHEQESRDTALKYQKEVEDLMLKHHTEIKTARTRNEQAFEDSAAKHEWEIEALKAKHKEQLEVAAERQEQALRDAAAKYQEDLQSLEAKHLEESSSANRDEQESRDLSAKHQQELEAVTAKHQEELEKVILRNKQDSGNAAVKSQQAIETMVAKHREEIAKAASQNEDLRAVIQEHEEKIKAMTTTHNQTLQRVTLEHQQELRGVTTNYDQELQEAKAKCREFESALLEKDQTLQVVQKNEEEAVRLRNQLETAAGSVVSLETSLRDLALQRDASSKEAALNFEQELRTARLEYEEELQTLRTIYATAVEEITALRRTLQDVERRQREEIEEELQSLRTIYATAVEEITALRRKVEAVDQKRSQAVDEASSLKASWDDLELKRSEAVRQLTSLQGKLKVGELERSEAAVENALLRDKLELADRRFEQDQQAVSDLQSQIKDLQAQIAELSTDKNLDQSEAAVDAALFKDKLELADLEIHLHRGTISALQNEVERLRAQRTEDSADRDLDQNEAVVDVEMLKDKLELANIQIRQAKGTVSNLQEEIEGLKAQITNSTIDMDLDQDEAAVEIALLKNTLELSNLESHQDKTTITSLQKQLERLQAQVAGTSKEGPYSNQQLRDELSMLERHHAAQVSDLEALRADVAADHELREQGWKERADVWDSFASELQGMKTQLTGTVGGSSRVDSTD